MPFIQNLLEKSKNLQFNRNISAKRGHEVQLKTLKKLIQKAQFTEFGKAHNFEQILTKVGYKIIESVLIKILKYFDITHIHPNNCCGSIKIDNIILPSTLEITFLSKELTLCKNKIDQLPHQLDCPNVVLNDEIILDKSWYV